MGRTRRIKCLHCSELFRADARNRGRQKYCSKPVCRRAGKSARQRRWLEKPENRDYFRGPQNSARVRAWQQAHPGYWRQRRRIKAGVLQDACAPQTNDSEKESASLVLQDICRVQTPVLIGLIAHVSRSVLQDDIAARTRDLLQLGQAILASRRVDDRQARG